MHNGFALLKTIIESLKCRSRSRPPPRKQIEDESEDDDDLRLFRMFSFHEPWERLHRAPHLPGFMVCEQFKKELGTTEHIER